MGHRFIDLRSRLILVLSIAGLFHGRRVTAETEVLGKAVQTSAASA